MAIALLAFTMEKKSSPSYLCRIYFLQAHQHDTALHCNSADPQLLRSFFAGKHPSVSISHQQQNKPLTPQKKASLYCPVCTLSCKMNTPRGPAVSSLFSLRRRGDELVEVTCANTAALLSSWRRARTLQMRPFVLSTHSVALKPALKEVTHELSQAPSHLPPLRSTGPTSPCPSPRHVLGADHWGDRAGRMCLAQHRRQSTRALSLSPLLSWKLRRLALTYLPGEVITSP